MKMDDVKLIYRNYYRCPKCEYEWEDEWDSGCDDDCGECGMRHISPYESCKINGDEI